MRYRLTYDPRALDDIQEIIKFMREVSPDLPFRFRSGLAALLTQLDDQPERWPPRMFGIRRAQLKLTRKFIYYLDYRFLEKAEEIQIVQVIHQKASPRKWRNG